MHKNATVILLEIEHIEFLGEILKKFAAEVLNKYNFACLQRVVSMHNKWNHSMKSPGPKTL